MTAYANPSSLLPARVPRRGGDADELFFRDLVGGAVALRGQRSGYAEASETPPTPPAPAPIEIPSGFRMGVWVDVGGRSLVAHGARHAALLNDLGFSDACIMVNEVSSTGFAFDAVAPAAIRSFAALLSRSGTRLTLTSWLRPEKSYIDDLVRLLPPLAIEIGAQAIELDVESNWRSSTVRGFANRTEAAEYFYEALRRAVGRMEIAVTCEVDPMTLPSMVPILSRADLVVPQAYSTHGPAGSSAVGGVYGPRGLQSRAVRLHAEALAASGRPLLMGLAAYGRDPWPSVSSNAIMRMELEKTLTLRTTSASIRGARYWSWKHIAGLDGRGGTPANSYAADFFRRSLLSPGAAAAWPAPAALPASASAAATALPATSTPPRPAAAQKPAEMIERVDPVDPGAATAPGSSAVVPTASQPTTSQPTTKAAKGRVLQSVLVQLAVTRQRVRAAKVYDPQRDESALRAVDESGAPVDLESKIAAETRAWITRHRQVHPVLARAIDRLGASERVPILAWIFHEHELARKDEAEGAAPQAMVAAREAVAASSAASASGERPQDAYSAALRASIRPVLDAARARFGEIGVEVTADLGTVPVLVGQATKEQVEALSKLPEVTGLYLHETEGIEDLSNAIADARAAAAHAGGFKGANVRVAVWESTPATTPDLVIEETFDPSAAAGQTAARRSHAQLVTEVIKNIQGTGPKGFAPDCKIYSANKTTTDALTWAIVSKQCTVVNQSFHYSSEETDSGLSAVDLIADYLVTHPPYPTIVQAAGNGPATEYVNHKGFNTTRAGNHLDGAGSMNPRSVFKNPASRYGDRELPDLSANGTTVSAVGLSMTGTSFSSPAVGGTAAVLQSVDAALKTWPEGCRAILLASAGRNVSGGTWGQAAGSSTEGVDGSGALDTEEAVRIARLRARRNSAAAQRGWDIGRLQSSDLRSNGTTSFRYAVQVPARGPRRLKAALAWSSKLKYTTDASVTPPVKVTESKLTVDLDLWVYKGRMLVAHSSTFDNSFEIVEFDAERGASYEICIKRFSGSDWAWFGIAWTVC